MIASGDRLLGALLGAMCAMTLILCAPMPALARSVRTPARHAHRRGHRHAARRHKTRRKRPTRHRHRRPAPASASTITTAVPSPTASAPAAASAAAPGATPTGVASGDPASAATSAPAADAPSAWQEPTLTDPTTITLSPGQTNLVLSQDQDYVVTCPAPLEIDATPIIWGGHNVVFQDCNEDVSGSGWAAQFKDQSGTLWIHNVHFGGSELTGGIQLQEPDATVVLRDVLFDKVYGSYTTNHAELIQTWSGPNRLLIDGLTGATGYQGLFLLPDQYGGNAPAVIDLRHIDIDDTTGADALWLGDVTGAPADDASAPIGTWNVSDVYVDPNPTRTWPGWWLWPQPSSGDPTWASGIFSGVPPGGSYVTATASGATGVDETADPAPLAGEQP